MEDEAEKRLRLTKEYIQQLDTDRAENGVDGGVGQELRDQYLLSSGQLSRQIAATILSYDFNGVKMLRGSHHKGHKLSVTCVANDEIDGEKVVYSGSKEGVIIKWSLSDGKILDRISMDKTGTVGHSGAIFALASCGRYLASGSDDKTIRIWKSGVKMELFHVFKGHKDAVTGLVFDNRVAANGVLQLFSCSKDRNAKVWNVEEKSYIETLFGHDNEVLGIDSFSASSDKFVTCGGQDLSVRIWKLIDQSQLIYLQNQADRQRQVGSIECICTVDETHFVTGAGTRESADFGHILAIFVSVLKMAFLKFVFINRCLCFADDGSLSLWRTNKKKPVFTMRNAHVLSAKEAQSDCRWITSVCCIRNSDVVASASSNGVIRLWRVDFKSTNKPFVPLFDIPVKGFVNSLQFSKDQQSLIAAVGQEHRLGRWWRVKDAKNAVLIIPLNIKA